MFSALRQGSSVYILEKQDKLVLKTGKVTSHTSPQFTNSAYANSQNILGFVNITVDVEGKSIEFNNLPAGQNIVPYSGGTTVVSESKDAMITEVENTINNSRNIINSYEYHQKVISDGETILKELSPHFAKEKERDEEINNLNKRIDDIGGKMDKIFELLSNVGNK